MLKIETSEVLMTTFLKIASVGRTLPCLHEQVAARAATENLTCRVAFFAAPATILTIRIDKPALVWDNSS